MRVSNPIAKKVCNELGINSKNNMFKHFSGPTEMNIPDGELWKIATTLINDYITKEEPTFISCFIVRPNNDLQVFFYDDIDKNVKCNNMTICEEVKQINLMDPFPYFLMIQNERGNYEFVTME